MRYGFDRMTIGAFVAHKTVAPIGAIHKKRFVAAGISPANQATLNLYAGPFRFTIPETGFSQDMAAGQSSLDLAIEEFPPMVVCEELPLADGAVRYCISPVGNTKWRRYVMDIHDEHQLPAGSLVFPVGGSVLVDGATAELHRPVAASTVSGSGRAIVVEVV